MEGTGTGGTMEGTGTGGTMGGTGTGGTMGGTMAGSANRYDTFMELVLYCFTASSACD